MRRALLPRPLGLGSSEGGQPARAPGRLPFDRPRAAFTLIELLVAVAIAAAVLIGAWNFWSSGTHQIITAQRKLDAMRTAHLLFELLHRDLKNARTVLGPIVMLPPRGTPGKPLTAFFVDAKEYLFDPNTRRVSIAGETFNIGLFDELSFEIGRDGNVRARIAALTDIADPQARPDGVPHGGRTVLEMVVTVEPMRDKLHFPYVVEEGRIGHTYCSDGDPIDY